MLAHSPPVPLVIDHFDKYPDLTVEDEEGIILALRHRDRVRRIRFVKPIPILQKLIVALDGDFPVLEHLFIQDRLYHERTIKYDTNFNFPETFRAPHLRHLVLTNFAYPIESLSLTNMANLVTLSLSLIPFSAYFHPNALLQRLLLIPQLETLGITFNSYNPSRDVETQLLRTPITTPVTLPNLRWLEFGGTNTYLEALLPWITIPLLDKLQIYFFNRMIYSIPHLRQFMGTARNIRLKTATFLFLQHCLTVRAYPNKGAESYTFYLELGGKHFDWQVVSAAQVFQALKTAFSALEHLILKYLRPYMSSEWNNQADRAHWRDLLGSFGKVKTLRVEYGLVEQVSRVLQPGEGESPTGLFPELQELSYSSRRSSRDAFTLFIDAREKAGHPVNVVYF